MYSRLVTTRFYQSATGQPTAGPPALAQGRVGVIRTRETSASRMQRSDQAELLPEKFAEPLHTYASGAHRFASMLQCSRMCGRKRTPDPRRPFRGAVPTTRLLQTFGVTVVGTTARVRKPLAANVDDLRVASQTSHAHQITYVGVDVGFSHIVISNSRPSSRRRVSIWLRKPSQ